MNQQVLGLITGLFFGFLLQKGRVLRFEKQVGAMLLTDMTILKFMLTAIIVGMIGIQLLVGAGLVTNSIKTTVVGANLIGGLLFGAGWAVMGYCPGTAFGALGEGRWHAVWAIAGMITGAAVYAEVYPSLKGNILAMGNYGKITVPSLLNISPWLAIGIFVVGCFSLFRFFEKKGL